MNYKTHATPEAYKCGTCGRSGVRLWRSYSTFNVDLRCVGCAEKESGRACALGAKPQSSDQIGFWVPAVPSQDDCAAYWGYTSVPDAGVMWWSHLPLVEAGATCLGRPWCGVCDTERPGG